MRLRDFGSSIVRLGAWGSRLGAWVVGLGLVLLVGSGDASAWQIETGFSDACHESMSGEAAGRTIIGAGGPFSVGQKVPLPDTDQWDKLANLILEGVDAEYSNQREKFVLVSLVLGSRYPDSGGTAAINLSSTREMHVYSAAQEEHCLRSARDDGPKGNQSALQAARSHIREIVAKGKSYRELPVDQQVITRKTFVELYGEVDIKVWAPAFYAGYALHTFQDCFSHTIRSDNLERVLHVMNYTEAITEQHKPSRDGLAHSMAMDECHDRAEEIADVVRVATADYLTAFADEYTGRDPEAIETVLGDWATYEAGCTVENDICDSKWLDIAEQSKSGPLVSTPSCSAAGRGGVGLGWLLICMVVAYCSTSLTNSRNK